MKPSEILKFESKVLTRALREQYFEDGYVVCRAALDASWLAIACAAYERARQRAKSLTQSNKWFSLAPEHTADAPCIYRIERLPDQDEDFWSIATDSRLADLASDVLGPDVIYRDSMINVKPPGARGTVAWHQDFPFYPHTNVGTIQVLSALHDITEEQGPLCVYPGTHKEQIFDHYDETGAWTGEIRAGDLQHLRDREPVALTCSAGDTILLHPLTVHGSAANQSERPRPLLNHGMSSADSLPYTAIAWGNSHTGETLRGEGRRYAQHDDLQVRLPPDWSTGYTSIFEHQQS